MSFPSQEREKERLSYVDSVGYFAFLTVQLRVEKYSELFLCSNKILIYLNVSMYFYVLHSIYYITNVSLKPHLLWLMEDFLVDVVRLVLVVVFLVGLCAAVLVPAVVAVLVLVGLVAILFPEVV